MQAVLSYTSRNKRVQNIGDYIQSIAAIQYAGNEYQLIDRESLSKYAGYKVKIILNGWFMHEPDHWPPSSKIQPLFISYHLSPSAAKKVLTPEGIEYFKKNSPIGCRDIQTMHTLQSYGITAYFSSCLTTTLGKTYIRKKTNNDICFVDPWYPQYTPKNPIRFIKSISTLVRNFSIIRTIKKKKYSTDNIKGWFKAAQFYSTYRKICSDDTLRNAKYITHTPLLKEFDNEQDKFIYADKLLKYYSSCKLVVTSRIHAALPCYAIGTPSIFVNADHFDKNTNYERGRFEGLIDPLDIVFLRENCFTYKNLPAQKNFIENFLPKIADAENLAYIKKLDDACTTFFKRSC